MMAFQIGRARSLYEAAMPGIALLAPDARRCATACAVGYSRILGAIEEMGYDTFSTRAHLGHLARAQVLWRAWSSPRTARAAHLDARAAARAAGPHAREAREMGMIAAPARAPEARVARVALAGHGLLLVFSGIAFATFLAPPAPAWLMTPANQRFAAMMFQFGGQTTVVLGALAGIFHAASRLGWRRALAIFAAAFTISLGAELLGTTTGYPFGPYGYTTQLGYLIGGPGAVQHPDVVVLHAVRIAGHLRAAVAPGRRRTLEVEVGRRRRARAHGMGRIDGSRDGRHDPLALAPAERGGSVASCVASRSPTCSTACRSTNWLGWLLTGLVVARVLLAIVPPSAWAARVAPARLPLVLYAVNGVFPILICVGRGMWWAVILGTAAMALPLGLALSARRGGGPARARAVVPRRDGLTRVRIVVIGSGFGGLAAAIRLQQQGHEVTIVEQRDKPGGRAYVYEQDGFTFDGGPTIITAPWLIHELFERSGRRTDDYVRLVPIDPFYNIRFDDGIGVSLHRRPRRGHRADPPVQRRTTCRATSASPTPRRRSSRRGWRSSTRRSTGSPTC